MKKYTSKIFGVAVLAIFLAVMLSVPAQAAYWKQKFVRFSAVAGETLATGNAVMIKDADGLAYKADANVAALRPAVGVVGKGGTTGQSVEIVLYGIIAGYSSLTESAPGYLSETPGAITQSAPAWSQQVGLALSSTTYLINCQNYLDTAVLTVADYIVVRADGSDTLGSGSFIQPYASITKAFTQVTTAKKKVLVYAGSYEEAASVTWPDVNGVELTAIGGVATITAPGADQVIKIDPAAAAGTWSATLSSICIDAEDGQVGLQVDNASVGKRINLYLKNFSANQETATDASIDINRSGAAGDAIRVYAEGAGELIEGLVTVITESTDDRFRFKGMRLIGGLTVAGAVASEVTLIDVGMKTSGLSVNGSNKLTNIGCWYETDANPNVYTNFANAFATYP
jgi:hypothetical protein